jgi:FkbM family methyltransferase
MTVLSPAKRLVKSLFNAAGLEIRKKHSVELQSLPRDGMAGVLNHLRHLGLRPRTVIDVGVATQTSELYRQFKQCRILLIEPLAEFEPFLQRICSDYDADYILAAAGEKAGAVVINVHPDKVGSSLFKEVEGSSVDGSPREVRMVTLDDVCAKGNFQSPYLIKIDVQGAELRVLSGASRILKEAEAVILEVTLFGTMIGGPQLYDVVSKMKELGFVVYDLYGLSYRLLDGALSQVDMVFVQENGQFRASHVYATPWQRKEVLKLHLSTMELERQQR